MKKETIVLIVGVVALAVGTYLTVRPTQPVQPVQNNNSYNQANRGKNKNNCLADDCLLVEDLSYPVGELPDEVIKALNQAIDDEYKAYTTYGAVINKFGNIRPFIMIKRAEEQHISSLKAIYDKYGIEIPVNNYIDKIEITVPDTVAEACAVGVQAEIDNVALYKNDLLPMVENYEDIKSVFNNLMTASETKHLPAFQSCSN